MSLAYGIAVAAAQIGLQSILVRPRRGIGPFTAHVTLSERHVDELEIVDHPVDRGAQVSDHAYIRPPEVVIECAWSDSPPATGFLQGLSQAVTGTAGAVSSIVTGNSQSQVRDVYAKLVALQRSVTPFDVYTGKRPYKDMLVRQLVVETDKENENSLKVTAVLRQVLFASVQVVQVSAPADQQADPEATQPSKDLGTKSLTTSPPNFNMRAAVDALTPAGTESVL